MNAAIIALAILFVFCGVAPAIEWLQGRVGGKR